MVKDPYLNRTVARLRAICAYQNTSLKALAEQTGKTYNAIQGRFAGDIAMSVADISEFSRLLGYTVEEIFAERFTLHEYDPSEGNATGKPEKLSYTGTSHKTNPSTQNKTD